MKTIIRLFQTTTMLLVVFALPQIASAAKSFNGGPPAMTATPTSINVTAGLATNVTTVIALFDGNTSSSVGNNSNCVYSVSVTTNGVIDSSDMAIGLSVTNFTSLKGFQQTPILTVTSSITALTLSNTYVLTIWANNNPSNSTAITPISATFTITMVAAPPPSPVKVWSPAGVDTNWSTGANWTPAGVPGSTNDLFFYDIGTVGSAGAVNNVLNNSMTIGSLTYGQTNDFFTTLIASGKTLTVVDTNGLVVGTGSDVGSVQVPQSTITGAGGALVVSNLNAIVIVSQASPSSSPSTSDATLDLSGLGVFNGTISRLIIGVDTALLKGANGVLNLARTNIITMAPGSVAPQISVGEGSQSSAVSATGSNTLLLGQTNAFFIDSIAVGRGRADNGLISFNSAFSSPTAYFRGTNGTASRVGTWTIGDGFNGKLNSTHATNDFSLGTVNALVDTMNIGVGANVVAQKPTPGKGVIFVNAGSIDVNNLNVGVTYSTNGGSFAGNGDGTVNMTGGSLVVNSNLTLASTAVAGIGSGTLNISSATVTANNGVSIGAGTAIINLTSSILNVTNSTATIGTSNTPLGSFAITNSVLNLAIQSSGEPSIATTNLAVGTGPNTINVISPPLITALPGQYQVIQYGINGGSSSGNLNAFVLGSLPPAIPAYGAYLSNNVANNSIDIVFTNGPVTPILTWDGTNNGNWNTSTPNWRPASGPDTVYVDTAFVTFDDSLKGTTSVSLVGTLLPGTLTVNNTSSNYVFGGTGKISGTVGLVKSGPGSLILDNSGANDFSGGVTINNGTLQIGNNDANGNFPSDPCVDNGALVFSRSDATLTVANVISGTGTLTQNGTGVLALSATNTSYSGAITVLKGTLQAGSPKAFGTNQLTGSITITNAGTLDVNFQKFGAGAALPVTVSGLGVSGNGAIVNNASNQTSVLHIVTLAGDTTIGGSGNWDIRTSGNSVTNNDAQLNGAYNLTKVGTNTITLTGVQMDPGMGNINVQAGTLDVANMTSSLGNPVATATVFTNATLVLDSLSNAMNKVIVLNDGGILKGSSTNYSGGPVTFGGPVTLLGAGTFTANSGALLLLTNTVSGSGGSLTKSGSGVVFLAASNSYSGNTVVSGGTLALTNYNSADGSINASTNININSGASIDVSGRSNGTLTLKSGQTLVGGVVSTNGPGAIRGVLIANSGATVAPGTGSTNIGALSVTGNATLQGATVMKISAAAGNDQIAAASLTYGGNLVVTNCSGTITNGEIFKLFVASNGVYNAGSFSSITLPTATGLSWTTNLTVDGTITANVVTGPSPTPVITNIGLIGTNLHLNGTNGASGGTLYVLASTNLALPLTNWIAISTNSFTGSGTFNVTVTNAINPNTPQSFYIISQPH
jgi:autotransporter-associated beta strand protein